jgi:four helix bundle protein
MESYRDLKVWQVGMQIAEMCYRLTQSFPKEEMFGMTGQIRRAASRIPANIAEGYGRNQSGEYVYFLRIAQGSLKELETHLLLAVRVDLASEKGVTPILSLCAEEGRMLLSLIRAVESRKEGGSRE